MLPGICREGSKLGAVEVTSAAQRTHHRLWYLLRKRMCWCRNVVGVYFCLF